MPLTPPRPLTVLFSSAGRRVELMHCFRADASKLGVAIRTLAIDVNPSMSAACQAADHAFRVPPCTSPDFIPHLIELCRREEVRLLVPTIDTELEVLARHRQEFEAGGTRVAVSSPELVGIARDKEKTAAFLTSLGILTPRTGTPRDLAENPGDWRWPILLKPTGGSSSIGIHTLQGPLDLEHLDWAGGDFIAQEKWAGREYTVNLYFDRNSRLRCAVPHYRLEVRAGEVSKGMIERVPELMAMADTMAASVQGAYGALCFQAIVTPARKAAVFEINARFGGGYPLAHYAGAQFSKWLLEDVLDRTSTANNSWRERVMMLRYDAAVFTEDATIP